MAFIATTQWLSSCYGYFNKVAFGGKLPNISLSINNTFNASGFDGFTKYIRDDRNQRLRVVSLEMGKSFPDENYAKSTLLHEMIHVEDFTFHPEHFYEDGRWIGNTYHPHGSEFFEPEMRRINSLGIKGVKVIKGPLMKDLLVVGGPGSNGNSNNGGNTAVIIVAVSKKVADSRYHGNTCLLAMVPMEKWRQALKAMETVDPKYAFLYEGEIPQLEVCRNVNYLPKGCSYIMGKDMASVISKYGLRKINYWEY